MFVYMAAFVNFHEQSLSSRRWGSGDGEQGMRQSETEFEQPQLVWEFQQSLAQQTFGIRSHRFIEKLGPVVLAELALQDEQIVEVELSQQGYKVDRSSNTIFLSLTALRQLRGAGVRRFLLKANLPEYTRLWIVFFGPSLPHTMQHGSNL